MIGQTRLKENLNTLITNNTFPRFSLLVGPEGSGKKMMSKWVADELGLLYTVYGTTVDDVRQMITDAHKVTMPTMFVVPDADKMSPAAKNAMLKVTEEPPQSAYFMLTLQTEENTLGTIRSRATQFNMDPYSVTEIDSFYQENYSARDAERKIVTEVCSTPGDVRMLMQMGAEEFYAYADKVVDNIEKVSGANSFKIAQNIKMKDTEEKYDLKLFWRAFMSICTDRLTEDRYKYAGGIRITSKYLSELRITGINKASTFDMWLLDIRKEWM